MNGTFEVKTQTNNSTYEYTASNIIVQGSYVKAIPSGDLQQINGQCYRPAQGGGIGEFFGNFNGFVRTEGGEVRYSMSEMSRQDANLVWDAIDEIELAILGENE